MSKRVKSTHLSEEFPLDCWGKIISFLSTKEDFMSLILSVKGLWKYVNTIFPKCTEHIVYSLPVLKNENIEMQSTKNYVSNLIYKPYYFSDNELKSYESAQSMLEYIRNNFPNLLRMRIIIKVRKRRTQLVGPSVTDQYDSVKEFVKFPDFSRLSQSLRILEFQFSVPRLRLHLPFMPRIVRLIISRKCLCMLRKVSNGDKMTLEIPSLAKNFPNLRHLRIHCCSRRRSLDKTGLQLKDLSTLPQLENLVLENEVPEENEFPEFKELTFLSLVGATARYIRSIQLLKKLRILKISIIPKGEREKRYQMELTMNLLIEGFPNLEKVRIRAKKTCSHGRNKGTLCLKNLPKLTAVKLVGKKDGTPFQAFPVSISAPKLEVLICVEWGAAVDTTMGTGLELKKITFFRTSIGKVLKASFPKFKKLEEFQYRVSITDPLNPESAVPMVMKDFPVLKRIFFPDVVVGEISNCPRLESIRLHPEENIILENLPSLKEVIVSIDRLSDLNIYQKFIQKVNQDFPSVKTISLHPYRFKDLRISNGDELVDHNVECLIIDFRRPFSNDRNFCIDLRNFSWVECFRISMLHFNFPKVFILKNFKSLKSLNLSSLKLVDTKGEFSRIHLENLTACQELHVGRGFGAVQNVCIINVPITKLHIDLLLCRIGESGGYFMSSLQIEGSNFPVLESIHIKHVKKRMSKAKPDTQTPMNDFYRIGLLSSLKNLKLITIDGELHNFKPFVRVVRNIDLEKVMIACRFARIEEEQNFSSVLFEDTTMKFGEYISTVDKFGVKIEVEEF